MTSSSAVPAAAPPLWRSVPPAASNAGQEAVELAASAGLFLDPWQQLALIDALGEKADGRWSSFEVALIVARQNGKGSIIEARELAGLFLFGESLIMHSAHEFKTASEAFRRILSLIENTPDLDKRVKRVTTANGNEGIELRGGQRLRFVARSKGSGRGFTGDCIILDEAYNLSRAAMSALVPTMSAVPNPQLWYTSSAPLDSAESDVLRDLCQRGREGSPNLTYLEWCAGSTDPDAPAPELDDRAQWHQANPGMGVRISEEYTEKERAALSSEDFARERLGLWSRDDHSNRVIPADAWAARRNPDATPGTSVVFGLDVAPDRSTGAVGVSDGRYVEVVDSHEGTAWIAERVAHLCRKHDAAVAIDQRGAAASFIPILEADGVTVVKLSTADAVQACGTFFDAATEGDLVHIGDPPLDAAVEGADRRPVGEAWVWSRKTSSASIVPLNAVTFARFAAAQSSPSEVDPFVVFA